MLLVFIFLVLSGSFRAGVNVDSAIKEAGTRASTAPTVPLTTERLSASRQLPSRPSGWLGGGRGEEGGPLGVQGRLTAGHRGLRDINAE